MQHEMTHQVVPRVVSVNVGEIREVGWRGTRVTTAIWKSSVNRRVMVQGVNLDGDAQADRTVHGGEYKAVYAYAMEDYEFWAESEGIALQAGLFGENLTVCGLDLRTSLVGERWSIGTAALEVTQPRLPCFKLGIRMNDPLFPKRFTSAGRPGAYLRIIEPGFVGAGDEVRVVSRPSHTVTLASMMYALSDRTARPALRAARELPPFWRRVAFGQIDEE